MGRLGKSPSLERIGHWNSRFNTFEPKISILRGSILKQIHIFYLQKHLYQLLQYDRRILKIKKTSFYPVTIRSFKYEKVKEVLLKMRKIYLSYFLRAIANKQKHNILNISRLEVTIKKLINKFRQNVVLRKI